MMPNQIPQTENFILSADMRLLELMASKICHDLISPVGAVSNGVEILEELGPDAGADVTGLIAFSATQAAAKLKALRLAYGQGGGDSSIKPEEAVKAFSDFIAGDGRITLDPVADDVKTIGLGVTGFAKILICGLLLVVEALPKGGFISIEKSSETNTLVLKGIGENAGFRDGYQEALALSTPAENLSPKHVHACLTGLLSNHYGFSFSVDAQAPNTIVLKMHAPVV